MYRLLLACLIMLLFTGILHAQEPQENVIGINLAGVYDWTTEQPFVDVFKTSRPWISQKEGAAWGEGGDLALTPEGWVAELAPGQYAETLMFTSDPAYPGGEYTVLYDGEGKIAFGGGNVQIVSEEAGRLVVDVTPNSGAIFLQVRETNPANPLRNIRFIMPGHEATYETQPFTPLFLERLAPFTALRFMDWMQTNETHVVNPEDRPQVTDATYMIRGVPVEIMVQLANSLHADPWFNMPHQASDDYVREFATIVRDNLDPELQVYVEYSNETWNAGFPQYYYVTEQGSSLNLAPGDEFWSGLRFHSQQAVEMFAIWEEVFGGRDRLVRVLAAQSANAWTGEQIITWQNAYEHADAIAIAPYFSCDDPGNPETVETIAAMSVDELLDRQAANVQPGGCAVEQITAYADLAQQYGLTLVAYEGGQHLAGYAGTENNQALTDLFIAANRHPRMGEIYLEYLHQWQAAGGELFMAFTDVVIPSQWGSWGVLEYLAQDPAEAPKYQALLTFIEETSGN